MWWPFAKKQEVQQKSPSEWGQAEERVAALRAWRNVGQEFEYLGRRLVVVEHSRVEIGPGFHFPTLRLIPELRARYADDCGELHTLVMSEAEVVALMAQSMSARKIKRRIKSERAPNPAPTQEAQR